MIDAARSFNQALRLDSRLALAYVGLSVAHDENEPAGGGARWRSNVRVVSRPVRTNDVM